MPAHGQAFPSHPVTIVVPYPAGGPTDTIARLIGERMRASLGQPVVIENVAGAGGNIGVGRVARAAGDGYTLSIGHWGSHVVNGAIYTLPYDLLSDLRAGRADLRRPAADRRGEVRAGEGHQGTDRLAEGQSWQGHGRAPPASAARRISPASCLQHTTGTDIQIVPYRGAAPRMQDMLAGQIHLAFDQAASSLPQVRGGNLQAYAVTSKDAAGGRARYPDRGRSRVAGLLHFGLARPLGPRARRRMSSPSSTPPWSRGADPTVRERLTELGQELPASEQQTPEALGAYQKAEIDKWWPIIKAAGIKVD